MEETQPKTSTKELVAIIAASTVGTLIEWYDFFIFGSLASIISTQFFPKENATASFLATLATFAAGFVVRPFGALFFGRIGDMIGRKYTFMVTLILMGGATFAIGLVPTYETIGFFAPLTVLILRLLQGLAIGGEYGGAAIYVAEHSPIRERGFWTSWIQTTAATALVISLGVILITKSNMQAATWDAWGWRIPFLISIFLVGVSVYIRKNMAESPLFAKAKAEGKTSANPLKDSFANKQSLKTVLLVLFSLAMGQGVATYASVFYSQSFLLKVMFIDFDQANTVVMIALLLGTPLYIFFGWLSDRIGRKIIFVTSMFFVVVGYRPVYERIYQTTNLEHKTEIASNTQIDTKQEALPNADSLITTTTQHFYTDGTSFQEVKKSTITAGKIGKTEVVKTIKINDTDKWTLIFLIFLLMVVVAMAYGPIAAFLVELFPLKIRYTALSLPYHIGTGIFGGLTPVIATYLAGKASDAHVSDYYLAGMTYPVLITSISLVMGLLYLKDNKTEQSGEATPSTKINKPKRLLGIVWILLGLAAAYFGIMELGLPKIMSGKQDDLIFGIIMLFLITPIATVGLLIMGKFALQGEYEKW